MTFEKRILADGRATLYRGDSLELLHAGVFGKIGAIVSDPPYGIGYQHSGHESALNAAKGNAIRSKADTPSMATMRRLTQCPGCRRHQWRGLTTHCRRVIH